MELEKVEELDESPSLGTREAAFDLYPVLAENNEGKGEGVSRESQLMQRDILDHGMVLKTSHAENATNHR